MTAQTSAFVNVHEDGRMVFDHDFDVYQIARPEAQLYNTALAFASCADCRGVAVSFQIATVA